MELSDFWLIPFFSHGGGGYQVLVCADQGGGAEGRADDAPVGGDGDGEGVANGHVGKIADPVAGGAIGVCDGVPSGAAASAEGVAGTGTSENPAGGGEVGDLELVLEGGVGGGVRGP